MKLAQQYSIPTGTDWKNWLDKDVDIIMEATGDKEIVDEIIHSKDNDTIVIPGYVAYINSQLDDQKNALLHQIRQQRDNQELILNHITDGMIVINKEQIVQFVN